MSRGGTGSILADSLRDWQPGTAQLSRRVERWLAAAFADLIGAVPPRLDPGHPLPAPSRLISVGRPRRRPRSPSGRKAPSPR